MAVGAAGEAKGRHALRQLACAAIAAVFTLPVASARAADPVIATAGDVACSASSSNFNGGLGTADRCRQKYTSDLLVGAGLAAVLPLGDLQYQNGTLSGFQSSYDLSWGRVKSISRPAAGNHEYGTAGAAGYFDYFNGVGVASGLAGDRTKGYYSFNVGTWHLIALNSTDKCTIVSCAAGSAQEQWLRADLAANADKYCTLAYWHDPRFNSGFDGNADEMQPLFQALYNADADVVLGGHAHDYERFAPQNPSGQLDNARGIRQFVVGSGGAFWTSVSTPKPNSQVRQNNTYGVLKLTLRPTSYDWQFVSESNKPFTDSGTGQCHGGTPPPTGDTTKPSVPGNLTATASVWQVALNWNASTDNVGVTGYRIYRGGTQIGTVGTTTSYTDTTVAPNTSYSYTVRAEDAAGNLSDPSTAVSVTTPAATSFTFAPDADAYVDASTATTNYATAKLRTDGGSTAAETFVRFNLTGIAGSVASAKLRVYAYTATVDGPAVYTSGTAWSETTINWNNRPSRTSAARDDKGAIASNTWVEYDVTPFVTGNGTYSFNLMQTVSDGVDYRSREYATTTQRPELVVTTAGPDTQKPAPPGGLTATPGTAHVGLSWAAATDNVGVTGYRVFRGTQQVATLGNVTSYTDSGLAPGTYSYTVRAVDAAGNVSDPSGTATATVSDTTNPGPPASLSATGGAGQVALSWGAASDNVGVTGYRVFRGAQQVAELGNVTSYTDTGLAPGSYTYTVRAVDAAGNLSAPSSSATATVPDTTRPNPPGGLSATAGTGQVALTWQAASDDVGVTGYRVFRGVQQIATLGNVTSYTETGLAPGAYSYTVRALDAAGNVSDPSASASATVPDTTKPSPPPNLDAVASAGQVALTWDAAADDVGVTGYRVYRGTTEIASLGAAARSHTDAGLAAGDYTYTVRAVDAAGNASDPSNSASATVPDTTKPAAPANLDATANGPVQADLTWDESTDDVGVTGYEIYRDGALVATVAGTATSWSDTVLPGTYTYEVRALDAAGNRSDPSNPATVTLVPTDGEPPAPPSNLAAVVTGTGDVDLTWDAALDNVAVTGYRVYRDTALIETTGDVTSWSDTDVAPGGHTYEVRAEDAAGNLSDPSDPAAADVPDVTGPSAPANLTATVNGDRVELQWEASSDDVAVTGYRVLRGDVEVASLGASATSHTDTGLAPGGYSYTVRARDAAGNESGPSTADATILDETDPSAPANLTATVNGDQVELQWEASSDDVAVSGYRVLRGDVEVASLGAGATSHTDTGLAPGDYSYTVRALDAAGNESGPSNSADATVLDTAPPDAPAGLTATANGSAQVDLSWSAASDNVAVTSYEVYRGGTLVATIDPATSHADAVLPGDYSYEVRALDAAGNRSDPSNAATVTVYPPDDERPAPPANLTARPAAGQVDLTWDAATDNIGVTGYEVHRNGAPIATLGDVTSYSDTSVAAAVPYTYDVRALDAAGNVSDASNTADATVPDTSRPSAPANLGAAATASQVDLTWDAAGDDVAVTGYTIYRDGGELATVGAVTSYTDTSVSAPGYDYVVRAFDAAGNLSDPSNTATAAVPDVQKPEAPGALEATAVGPGQVDLTWQAATDNIAVTGYRVYRDSTEIATLGNVTSWSDTGVAGSTTYGYEVRAADAAGNVSDPSNTASATTPAASAVFAFAPEADARVHAGSPTTNYATSYLRANGGTEPAVESYLRFTVSGAPAGSVRSAKLRVFAYSGTVDGPAVFTTNPAWSETAVNWNNRPPRTSANADDKGAVPTNSWIEYDVTPFVTGDGTYSFGLSTTSGDGVDIRSREALAERPELVVTTGPPDTQKPTPPTSLGATAVSATQVDLAWGSAGDNVGVIGYRVFRDGNAIATLGVTTAYSDTGVSATRSYTYEVRALDAAGNLSDPSNTASVTTPAQTTFTFSPEADAYVDASTATTNYATAKLRTDGGSTAAETFVRFNLTGIAGSVASAKLRVYAYTATVDGPAVYTSGTAWSETTINWNNRPSRTSAARDDKGAIASNTWVEYDVTPFVTGNGTYSFNLMQTVSDGVDYRSREYATTTQRPELVVTPQP